MKPLFYGQAQVFIHPSRTQSGTAAALRAADLIREAILRQGHARLIVGTGNSQVAFIDALIVQPGIDWKLVRAFHMDEYVGLSADHPASFRRWLRTHVAEKKSLAAVHYLCGDATDLTAEIKHYSQLLSMAPIDLAFVGFGENGHIAFNDPPNAKFDDPERLKVVRLDDACRRQQVSEGHFANVAAMPQEALTLTCPELFRARAWICCVPEARKAEAVRNALEGPIDTACPASLVRTHPAAQVFLDVDSASRLANSTAAKFAG